METEDQLDLFLAAPAVGCGGIAPLGSVGPNTEATQQAVTEKPLEPATGTPSPASLSATTAEPSRPPNADAALVAIRADATQPPRARKTAYARNAIKKERRSDEAGVSQASEHQPAAIAVTAAQQPDLDAKPRGHQTLAPNITACIHDELFAASTIPGFPTDPQIPQRQWHDPRQRLYLWRVGEERWLNVGDSATLRDRAHPNTPVRVAVVTQADVCLDDFIFLAITWPRLALRRTDIERRDSVLRDQDTRNRINALFKNCMEAFGVNPRQCRNLRRPHRSAKGTRRGKAPRRQRSGTPDRT